jgi:hypothetical protein
MRAASMPTTPLQPLPRPRSPQPPQLQALPTSPQPLRRGVHPMVGALSPTIGAMAQELASGLTPGREVLARYGVPVADFRRLMAVPAFVEMVRKAKQDFSAVASTPDRVRLKAQLLTEMGLDEMWGIVQHAGEPAAARVSAYNSIKNLTGMDRPEEARPMQKFSLKIVLPPTGGTGTGDNSVTISSVADTEALDLSPPVPHDAGSSGVGA